MRSEGRYSYLTAEEMAETDRVAIEDYGIDVRILMENAGVSVARLAKDFLRGNVGGRRITILAGKGNNGGDGLVAARHLHDWGSQVRVILGSPETELRDAPATELGILRKMKVEVLSHERDFGDPELVVDALLGYNSKGDPREPIGGLIRRANGSGVPILAVDLPSGLDATKGEPYEPCVRAKLTLTFAFPKTGFLNPKSKSFVGSLYLADISIPAAEYRKHSMGQAFAKDQVVRLW